MSTKIEICVLRFVTKDCSNVGNTFDSVAVAWDLATLGEPLPVNDVFVARYDRMYCSTSLTPTAVMDFQCDIPCPNKAEPSDHLPVAVSFQAIR